MTTLQTRDVFTNRKGQKFPIKIEFISANSSPQKHLGSYYNGATYSQAYVRRRDSKRNPNSFRKPSIQINESSDPLGYSMRDGIETALSYAIIRYDLDSGTDAPREQSHLVISAPPSDATKPGGDSHETYLLHRGTRMADAYCETLDLNPRWSVDRVIISDVIDHYRWMSRNIPVDELDDSIIEAFSSCTHVHLFDDHIVYGTTMRRMLREVISILLEIGRMDPHIPGGKPPVISVVSWHSVTVGAKIRRQKGFYEMDLIIPPDVISGEQRSATKINSFDEEIESSKLIRASSILSSMGSKNTVGQRFPVNGLDPIFISDWKVPNGFAYDIVRRVGHLYEDREVEKTQIDVPEEALSWYVFKQE